MIGMTRFGGGHSPSLPHIDNEPFATLSRIVEEMKSLKLLQILLFSKHILGGRAGSYCLPLNWPLKGLKNSNTETPSEMYLKISSRL